LFRLACVTPGRRACDSRDFRALARARRAAGGRRGAMKTGPTIHVALFLPLALLLGAGCEAASNAANGAGAVIEHTAEKIGQKTNDAAIVVAVKGELIKADDKLSKV